MLPRRIYLSRRGRSNISKADNIFIAMCQDILENGVSSEGQIVRAKWDDGTPAHTIKQFAVVNRYDLAEEFPIMTLRPTNLKAAIDEVLWIWQKKSNNINQLNSRIWDAWADPDGLIGKTYGYQLGVRSKYPEGEFDQVDRVIFDLKNNPYSRRIMTNMYNHHDLHEMNLYPCCYNMTFNVVGDKLNGILSQRSQDVLVANNWDVCHHAIVLIMFAQVTGFKAGEFVHAITDAHIYDRHIDMVEKLIQRETYPAPRLIVNPKIKSFYDFTVNDFRLENYLCGPQIKNIPVAV